MILTKDNLNEALADAVMDRPREFFIDKRRFCLWSPSLGMSMMLEGHIANLGVNPEMMIRNHSFEALRIAVEKRNVICDILAILSFRDFSQLSDSRTLAKRAEYFCNHLSDEDLAQLILMILSEPRIDDYISLSGLADDQKDQSRIAEIKNNGSHNRTFGGHTIYGLLIDAACKAYGWTKQYVVWGIDLVSLRMMLADSVCSVYLSDEEIKQFGGDVSRKDQRGMTKEDFLLLRNEFKD